MAIKKISYNNKVALSQDPLVPLMNQVTADDMNEIKDTVNTNGDEVQTQGIDISNITASVASIIADMNDFNIDITKNYKEIVLPAGVGSSTNVNLERGIYVIQSVNSSFGENGVNINQNNNLWSRYNSTKAISNSSSFDIGTSMAVLIYAKQNCYVAKISSVSEFNFYQSVIPITEIVSIFNVTSTASITLRLLKIKSFD